MDLQGVGALAAAGVAAVGIPAALIVGRWQLRAALRSAEATSQTGIAQAEATYRAALDQTKAQNTASYQQWRRNIRRDAWSKFLLVIEDAVHTAERALTGQPTDLAIIRRDSGAAFVVLELEGPPSVVAAAELLVERCRELLGHAAHDEQASSAWRALEAAMETERTHPNRPAFERSSLSRDTWMSAHYAHTALEHLRTVAQAVRDSARGEDTQPLGPRYPDAAAAYEALEAAHTAATEALARCNAIDDQQAQSLINDAANNGRFVILGVLHFARQQLNQARTDFISGVRSHLDGAEEPA
ncbi:hypothetical protein [Streptomyces sp. S.PNR 29]|uniref:hypothetical protein n=1 Tax=Streptomyces sp. S.PNR 29 TaxID=2973805 RepID=UPI0025B16A5B|nr:hypothetical protein [Streptomyces sp. S.PNR 29]MDN0200777.1 hypothetical protein [Streptomyces sp. S.PNR 29]